MSLGTYAGLVGLIGPALVAFGLWVLVREP
jgi:hypothetical protein